MEAKGKNSVRKLQKSPSGDFCGEVLLGPLLGVCHKQPGDGGGGHVLLDCDADVPHLGDVEVFGPHAVAVGVEHKLMDHADAQSALHHGEDGVIVTVLYDSTMGAVTPSTIGSVDYGTEIHLLAEANIGDGYVFNHWVINGEVSNNDYELRMIITEDIVIEAEFTLRNNS